MNEEYNSSQWPPPPDFGPGNETQSDEPEAPTRLLTGSCRGDAVFGVTLSLVSFTLLIFALINPLATLVLPSSDKFPTGLRLLTDWFFASVVQYTAWKFSYTRNFRIIGSNLVLTAFPTSIIWLSISLLAWAFG